MAGLNVTTLTGHFRRLGIIIDTIASSLVITQKELGHVSVIDFNGLRCITAGNEKQNMENMQFSSKNS